MIVVQSNEVRSVEKSVHTYSENERPLLHEVVSSHSPLSDPLVLRIMVNMINYGYKREQTLPSFSHVFGGHTKCETRRKREKYIEILDIDKRSVPHNCNHSFIKEGKLYNVGRWSDKEHNAFMEGISIHGTNFREVQKFVKTRTITQLRTHAQKVMLI